MAGRSAELQRLLANLNGSANTSTSDRHSQSGQPSGLSGIDNFAKSYNNVAHAQHLAAPTVADKVSKIDSVASRAPTPSKDVPDAAVITTWPGALKHVMKHIMTDEKTTARITHLIKEQHKHEEQWWAQRQSIVTQHAGRAGNQTKVADILKELGGLAVPVAQVDAAAEKNELAAFDKKVYKSMVQMTADFDGQLRKLGVPFFAIKHELVMVDSSKSDSVGGYGKLDKGELRELQKRMLQHLEDLLGDDG